MATTSFDTLTYAKKLQEAGFTPQQAEAQAGALRDVVDQNLATKHDIEALRRDMKEMEERLLLRMELLRRDILLRLGGIVVGGVTVLAAMIGVVIALVAI